jgi:hypothetical protein
MSEVNNKDPIERIIHQEFHDLADKHEIDVDTISEVISDWVAWETANIATFLSYLPPPSEN